MRSPITTNTMSQMRSVSSGCSVSWACEPVGRAVGDTLGKIETVGDTLGELVTTSFVPTSIQHWRMSLKRHPQMSLQLASVYETHGAHAVVQAISVIKIKNFIIWGLSEKQPFLIHIVFWNTDS